MIWCDGCFGPFVPWPTFGRARVLARREQVCIVGIANARSGLSWASETIRQLPDEDAIPPRAIAPATYSTI
jgi:hypothetical protein